MTPRSFLANEIRRLRVTKGMNQDALAHAVHVSDSLVRAWEAGRRVPQSDHLARLDEFFETNGYLARVRDDLVKDERLPEYMGRWRDIEQEASSLLTYEPLLVPGLLQTPDYAREVIEQSGRPIDDIEEHVKERMGRQQIIAPENGLMLVVVVDEYVLHRLIGTPEIMSGQVQRIVDVATQPNVRVQVVPEGVGAYPGLAGGFVIAAMDGQEFVYVDDVFSGDVIESPEDVATIKRVWVTLQAEALPAKQSIKLIEKELESWSAKS